MTNKRFFHSLILSAALTVTACGGGAGSDLNIADALSGFQTKFNSYIAALTSSTGLNSTALLNLFDEKFLEGGFRKADLVNSLTANASALGTNPELSLFPTATVTNSTLSGCDSNYICTLTGTLTNSDVDTTSIVFSTKVIIASGVIYFYGDQSSTSSN